MDYSRFKFALFFLILTFGQLASTHKLYCTPNTEELTECNWCWCMEHGYLVCTRMPCERVPKDLWGTLQLSKKQKKKRCLILGSLILMGVFTVSKMVGGVIFDKITEFLSGTKGSDGPCVGPDCKTGAKSDGFFG